MRDQRAYGVKKELPVPGPNQLPLPQDLGGVEHVAGWKERVHQARHACCKRIEKEKTAEAAHFQFFEGLGDAFKGRRRWLAVKRATMHFIANRQLSAEPLNDIQPPIPGS